MPEPKLAVIPRKKQLQALIGGVIVVLVIVGLILGYPFLQLALAEQLIEAGKYTQAEQILISLTANKQHRTTAGYRLVACQLFQGKGREAAQTVLSLTGAERIDDLELAIIFLDVAKHLLNAGNGEAALELAKRVRTQSEGEMVAAAVREVSMLTAEYSELPLALDAVNLALSQGENSWQANRKSFNLLLRKALESPPSLAEPALDRALELYPSNIVAITRKASIVGDKKGPQEALEFLKEKEAEIQDGITPEYLAVKRTLLLRLAADDPKADLTLYTALMPREMIIEIARQGLNYALLHQASGRQYYYLAPDEPQIVSQFGRNLVQMHLWDTAREVFQHAEEVAPRYMDYKAVYALLDSMTKTRYQAFAPDELVDAAKVSPDGKWLTWRRWRELPQEGIMVSDLVLTDLEAAGGNPQTLGDVVMFAWSPNSKHLALQTMTAAGVGRLHIYQVEGRTKYTLPAEYDVIDFNWADESLMVQAQVEQEIVLLRLNPPQPVAGSPLPWQLSSNINPDSSWLGIDGRTLTVYEKQEVLRTFDFEKTLVMFSPWSPNGNLSIVEDEGGKSWIYNHKQGDITPVEIPGRFAAWGKNQEIFWYFPVWDQQYILVSLNSQGSIRNYYPYSFDLQYYDISISTSGEILTLVGDNGVDIFKK